MSKKSNSSLNSNIPDQIVPDYDFLFNETLTKKGKKRTSFFKNIIKINIGGLILSSFVYLLQSLPTWIIPLITADIINIVTDAVSATSTLSSSEILRKIIIDGIILVVVTIQNIPTCMWRWKIVSKMLRDTSAGIKSSVIRKLQSLSITYSKDMQSGKIQSKFLRDTDSVDGLFNQLLFNIIPNIIGVIIATAVSIYKNGLVSLFFLFIIPSNILLTLAFRKTISKRNRDYRIKTENVSVRLSTMLDMFMVTKSHGLEKTEIDTIEKEIGELKGSGLKMDKVSAKFGSATFVASNILSITCLLFCSFLAFKKIIGVGDIVLYQSMFGSISAYIFGVVNVMPQLSSGFEALSSLSEIMNTTDIEVNTGKISIPEIEGNIAFDNVSYKYPNTTQLVLKNINIDVKKGECIAVVGSSGSGKSTIMNLIIGLLVPTEGKILIDGKPLTDFNLSEYRHHISVVPQNSILFAGSIRDNITYGLTHYTEEELNKAIELANLNEFLNDLPNGLDTQIGERGDKLSGGQKQRITIARALIRNPKILILDEATSALDNISEFHVQKAIASSIKGRTTFIVAHRLSTIRDANRILVVEEGRIIEQGTYDELMAKKGKFYSLKCLNDLNLKTAEEGLS